MEINFGMSPEELGTLLERDSLARGMTMGYEIGGDVKDTLAGFRESVTETAHVRKEEPVFAAATDLDYYARLLLMTEMTRRPEDAVTVIRHLKKHLDDLLRLMGGQEKGAKS